MTKRKTPFFFTFKALSNTPIFQYLNFSFHRHFKRPISLDLSTTRDYQGKRVNPHIGPLTKVVPLKLFLDIVPSSSADITRALPGQPKRLSQNYRRRNGGNQEL